MNTRTLAIPGAGYQNILGWAPRTSELGNPWHQCRTGLAVVGDVFEIRTSSRPDKSDVGLFLWSARTVDSARAQPFANSEDSAPRGYAATLEAAKEIVESLLHNTGTANRAQIVPTAKSSVS